jgi:hypothetical protein
MLLYLSQRNSKKRKFSRSCYHVTFLKITKKKVEFSSQIRYIIYISSEDLSK